ncbi:hypothetical protein Tco_0168757 [Tanacetum coccineum]
MSTPTYVDSKTITQADRAQSSRVPVPLPDDPYVAVRTVSSYSPVSSYSTEPLLPDHPLTHVSPTPTPTQVSFHCRTARMVVRTQPTLSPGMSARIAEATALSPSFFCKRYKSSYETSSSSSLTLPVRKRYKGTSHLILDTDSEGDGLGEEDTKEDEEDESDEDHGLDDEGQGLEDEGLGLEEEEVVPEGQQQAVPVVKTAASEPLGLGYGALRRCELAVGEDQPTFDTWVDPEDGRVYADIPAYVPLSAPVQTPPSPEWSLGSLLVSPSSPVVPSPIALPVATSITTISRLDALPPTLVAHIDRDVMELYTRSGAVRDEIFSQRYRFRILEREQERATMTFGALWRPVLALKAWAGHVDTRLADMSWARYDDHRMIYDMLVQHATMQREL